MDEMLGLIFSENFLATVIRVGVPLMFAAMSAYVASLSGMPNIAVEGIMLMSCLLAVLGSYWTQSAFLGLLIAIAGGLLMGGLIAFMTMRLGTSPILVGIALNTFSLSFTVFLLFMVTGNKGTSASLASKTLPVVTIPFIEKIPILRAIFSGQYTLTYVCFGIIILIAILVYKTPFGLRMKASGLDANAARSVGINVNRVRLIAVLMSAALAALGGAYMTLGYLSSFTKGMTSGAGWIGIAAQAMGGSNFLVVGVTTFFFSVFNALTTIFALYNLPSELITIIPYVGVFIGLVIFSIIKYSAQKKGKKEDE